MRRLAALLLLVAALAAGGAARAAPQRIVSINLCADQLLLELAPPERIAALSFLALDPHLSYGAKPARALPVTRGGADEVLLLKPDLVLAGSQTTRTTVALLRRLGIEVVELPLARSIEAVRAQIRQVGHAIGAEARAESLIAGMDARLARIERPEASARPLAAVYQTNGYSIGRDTLIDDLLDHAGLDNLSPRIGLARGGYLPLERLLLADPDIIVMEQFWPGAASLGQQLLRHPALRRFAARRRIVFVPARLWTCGGAFLAETVELLAGAARRAAEAAR